MSERLKNIGLERETHRALKLLCAQKDWTMTQAVDHLLSMLEKGEGSENERTKAGTNGDGEAAKKRRKAWNKQAKGAASDTEADRNQD